MKVHISPQLFPCRGGEVAVGNVYSNDHSRFFRIVVGIVEDKHKSRKTWNNVVCIHVDATGDIVGASCQPTLYVKEHQDLVGRVKEMPSMKIEWLREEDREKETKQCPTPR